MKIYCGVPGSETLPPAYKRAVYIERDLNRAVFLFSLGIRKPIVLRTLAAGKAAFDAVGLTVPKPRKISAKKWNKVLKQLANQYGERPYFGGPTSDIYSGSKEITASTAA